MYRTTLWSKAVKKYHEGAGDPTSETDEFLEVIAIIAKLKDKGAEMQTDESGQT